MRLSAKMLKNVLNVNFFSYANQAFVREGISNEIYFRLVNLDHSISVNETSKALPDNPIRYIPEVGAVVTVIFDALDEEDAISVVATNPFPEDRSIFKAALTSDQVPSSGNLLFQVVEGIENNKFFVQSGLIVEGINVGGC